MGDLISRQAALDAVNIADDNGQILTVLDILDVLKALPPVQPEEASMILGQSKDGVRLWYQCSACGEPSNADDNYCCNCGRKFRNG